MILGGLIVWSFFLSTWPLLSVRFDLVGLVLYLVLRWFHRRVVFLFFLFDGVSLSRFFVGGFGGSREMFLAKPQVGSSCYLVFRWPKAKKHEKPGIFTQRPHFWGSQKLSTWAFSDQPQL